MSAPKRQIRDLQKKIERQREQITDLENQVHIFQENNPRLQERLKELNCLHGLSNLIDHPRLAEEEFLQAAVDLLPPAWQYPENTTARIIIEGQEYTSTPFQEGAWQQTAPILSSNRTIGSLEVFYLEEKPEVDDGPFLSEERDLIDTLAKNLGRTLEHRRARKELDQISWMLSSQIQQPGGYDYQPEYGDLSALNTEGMIRSNVSEEQLRDLVSEYLDLLGTSAAVYERDGSYALGIFSSGWCQMMDAASRELCQTDSNVEALDSGKWLCHESCWTDASLEAIRKNRPVDIECSGGICLYAVPVQLNGEVVGAVNFGYGEPPQDQDRLAELSKEYQLPVEQLEKEAARYSSRPDFIIDYAKERLEKAAGYLGNLIALRLAERNLMESENNLRITLDSIGDAVIATDLEGRITNMNPVAEQLTGWDREQAARQPLSSVFQIEHARTGEKTPDPVKKVLVSGSVVGLANHTKLRSKTGQEYLISDSAAPIKDTEGNLRGVVLTFRDVTEDYRMHESLRESELRFRRIYENMSVGVAQVSLDFTIVRANEAYCRMLGYSLDELRGKKLRDITQPEILEENLRMQRQLVAGELTHYRMEKTFLHKDGHTVLGILDANLISDTEGRPLYFLGSVLDITERKQAEDSLKKNEAKYRNLFETKSEGVVYQDAEGNITSANPAAERILGLSLDQMQGKTSMDPRWKAVDEHGSELPGDEHPAMIALRTGKKVENFVQGLFIPEREEHVWILVNSIPQFKEEGDKPFQVYSTFTDITERKQSEEELQKLKDNLKTQVAEKTEELQQRVAELERFHEATIQREFRIKELRDEIEWLKKGKK
jgi:PAS domain S-box-containing protein